MTLSCIMLKNGQIYFKKLAVWTPSDFLSMSGHFSTLCMDGLNRVSLKTLKQTISWHTHIKTLRVNSDSQWHLRNIERRYYVNFIKLPKLNKSEKQIRIAQLSNPWLVLIQKLSDGKLLNMSLWKRQKFLSLKIRPKNLII